MGRKSKEKKPQDMLAYTSRDIGQEYMMKRKVVRAVIITIITLIALAVFIALYVDERKTVQLTYMKQYEKTLKTVVTDIESYKNAEGDLELRYRRLVADMNTAASFLFLLDGREDEKKAMQEIYTVVLKYPVQTKEKLDDIEEAINHVLEGMDRGYEEVEAIVESIDKKGQ